MKHDELDEIEASALQALKRLLPHEPGLLLAVSGGLDSMVLLEILSRILQCHRWKGPVVVAHLNHGLRGDAAAADAGLVEEEATRRSFAAEIRTLEPSMLQDQSRGSLEESARQQRYQFLIETARKHRLAAVVTAHQASDQAETILHNLFRGTGITGLRGMPEHRQLADGVVLVRPLLAWTRDELQHYASMRSLRYCQDESNQDSKFTRNRIRNEILPLLRQTMNPQIDAALNRLGTQTGELVDCLDSLADDLLNRSALELSSSSCRLQRSILASAPTGLLRHMFVRLWVQLGWPRQQMTARHWHQMADAAQSHEASFTLPGAIQLQTDGSLLRLVRR